MVNGVNFVPQGNFYVWLIGIGIFPFFINGYVNALLAPVPAAYWAFEVSYWVVLPAILMTVAVRRHGLSMADIGLDTRAFGKRNVLLLVLLCVAFCPVDLFVYKHTYEYLRTVFTGPAFFQYESIVPKADGWPRMGVAIYFALTAGVVEEVYFRGLFHMAVRGRADATGIYLVWSPLLFAIIHWEGGLANVFTTYLFGLFAAAIFLVVRNLWPLIFGHIYTDYVLFSQT